MIIEKSNELYSQQSTNLEKITLTESDLNLLHILTNTANLTKNVTPAVLTEVDELNRHGANYDYVFKKIKTFERFMLENEILSRIPLEQTYNYPSTINIFLSQQDVDLLKQKYHVNENDILNVIDVFSNINLESTKIILPDGRNSSIDRDGNIVIGDKVSVTNEITK